MTPYEVVYGEQLSSIVDYLFGTCKLHSMDNIIHNCEATLSTLKDNLEMA